MINRTNPKVNRGLKDEHFDHIDHALGRPVDPLRATFRNHFSTGGKDAETKAASPHWTSHGEIFESASFSVSLEGRRALADHLKEIGEKTRCFKVTYKPKWADEENVDYVAATSHSKAKYDAYLDWSDAIEMTFGEFLKDVSVTLAKGGEV